jgi:hypothetical protein
MSDTPSQLLRIAVSVFTDSPLQPKALYHFPVATVTNYHKLRAENSRNVSLPVKQAISQKSIPLS